MGKGAEQLLFSGSAAGGRKDGAFLAAGKGHVGGKSRRQALPQRADAQRGRDGNLALDHVLLVFHQVVPLRFLELGIDDHHQARLRRVVVHAHVHLAGARGGRPVNIPDRIAGTVGAHGVDQVPQML